MSQKHWRPTALALWLARGPVIGASLTITVIISALFGIWLSLFDATSMDVFRSQMAFTSDRFVDAVGAWGPAGLSDFVRLTVTLDFIYPAAYAVAIAGLWARFTGPTAWSRGAIPIAAALGAAMADWIENLLHLSAAATMVGGQEPGALSVLLGSAFATIKWVLLFGALEATALAAWRRGGRTRIAGVGIGLLATAIVAMVISAAI